MPRPALDQPRASNATLPLEEEDFSTYFHAQRGLFHRIGKSVENFAKFAPRVKISKTLDELFKEKSNNANKLQEWEKYCDTVLPTVPIIAHSMQYFDRNGKRIAAYLSHRYTDVEVSLESYILLLL